MHVVLLSPAGEVLFDEEHARDPGVMSESTPDPDVLSVFVQPELQRFVVHVVGGHDFRVGAWVYDLRTGAPILQHSLEPGNGPARGIGAALDVRPIATTPLVLAHWITTDFGVVPWSRGAIFELLDENWNSVWRLELPHDYEVDGQPVNERRDEVYRHSPILSTGPGAFDLRFFAEAERVSFAVRREGEQWKVAELARASCEPIEPRAVVIHPRSLGMEPAEAPGSIANAATGGWSTNVDELVLRDAQGALARRIERRPDGRWFRKLHGLAVAEDGSALVLEAWPSNYLGTTLLDPALALYGPAGEPLRVLPLPPLSVRSLQMAGGRALVVGFREAHLVELESGVVAELDLGPALSNEPAPRCRLTADGKEVVVWDASAHRNLRFALD